MSTKLFLSAVENLTHYSCAREAGGLSFLMSYFYLRKNPDLLKKRLDADPETKWMIDSGAHTFLKGDVKLKWDDYCEEYAEWLSENRDSFYCAVELDIADVVGHEKVKEWHKKFFNPLEQEGVPIVYVWHDSDGIKGWEQMCKDHAFIGINQSNYEQANLLFATARQYLCKVHGFAITREESMLKHPFYTADSTTWKAGERYGDFYFWDGMHMTLFKDKAYRRRYKALMEAAGINWSKIEADDNYELSKHNAMQFLKMERDCAARTTNVEYWTRRLPPPAKLEDVSRDDAAKYLNDLLHFPLDRGYEGEYGPEDDVLQWSRLQWGQYADFREAYTDDWYNWMIDNTNDDGDYPEIKSPDDATLDGWRCALNARAMQGMRTPAQKRTGPDDYKTSKTIKRREPEADATESSSDDESLSGAWYE